MKKFYDIEQRTTEWYELKKGLFSSSEISNLFVKARKEEEFSKTALTYITQKAMDSVYPLQEDSFNTVATRWGTENEPLAISVYELATGNNVSNGGFYKFDENTGSSPDGLVNEDGMVEIKCPYNRANHFNNILSLQDADDLYKINKQYYYQCHHQMFCSGRKWVDFCSFDPRLMETQNFLHVVRIDRNEELMDHMA